MSDLEKLKALFEEFGILEYEIIQLNGTIVIVTKYPQLEFTFTEKGEFISHDYIG